MGKTRRRASAGLTGGAVGAGGRGSLDRQVRRAAGQQMPERRLRLVTAGKKAGEGLMVIVGINGSKVFSGHMETLL
jgi:hypothetical protein